jgi:hypothetical protein
MHFNSAFLGDLNDWKKNQDPTTLWKSRILVMSLIAASYSSTDVFPLRY